jgi:hypothetical protein
MTNASVKDSKIIAADYVELLDTLKAKIRSSQIKASVFSATLPQNLRSTLPTIEQIEAELSKDESKRFIKKGKTKNG